MLEAFAVSVATAVATAQSVAADRRGERLAAAEQERERWARELHDETLQGLAALRLGLSAARKVGGRPALEQAVDAAIDQLQGEIVSLRALITELRPAALDDLGLHAAIRALASRAGTTGLEVTFAHKQGRADGRLTPELEIATYRIVQEALTNATKHGRAHQATVEITERNTAIEVTVRDDGAGFDAADPTNGFGLLGMRERAELLHGTLEIDSTHGHGTTIRATLPTQPRTILETPADLASTG